MLNPNRIVVFACLDAEMSIFISSKNQHLTADESHHLGTWFWSFNGLHKNLAWFLMGVDVRFRVPYVHLLASGHSPRFLGAVNWSNREIPLGSWRCDILWSGWLNPSLSWRYHRVASGSSEMWVNSMFLVSQISHALRHMCLSLNSQLPKSDCIQYNIV